MNGTRGAAPWLRFEIGGERFALPIEAVAEIVGLTHLRAAGVPGWAGLLAFRNGTLPVADGASLVGGADDASARGRALVLRGRFPLGMSVDNALGLGTGVACPLVARVGLPDLTMAAIPAADRPTLVLDPDRLWRRIWTRLEPLPGEAGFRLLPFCSGAGEARSHLVVSAPVQPTPVPASGLATAGLGAETGENPSPISVATATLTRATDPELRPAAAAATPGTDSSPVPPPPRSPAPEQRVLVFQLGSDLHLGVPAEQVLEVGPERIARPIPGGPGHLAGMLDWQGRLVPVVDLAARLGLSFDGPRRTLYLALTGRAARALAVQVGEVVGEARLDPTQGEQAELGPRPGWIVGVMSVGERRLAIVDPAALLVA